MDQWRAPSSPPETPEPMKRMFFRFELSPTTLGVGVVGVAEVDDDVAFVDSGSNCSITASTAGPAFTRITMRRGFDKLAPFLPDHDSQPPANRPPDQRETRQ